MDSAVEEDLVHHQTDTTAFVLDENLGTGQLFIRKSCVLWTRNDGGRSFSLQYPSISLHAISRDLNAFSLPCIYCMVDGSLVEMGVSASRGESQEAGEDDEEDCIQEVRFAPADAGALEGMYTAMCECQALHPDPDDDSSAEGDDSLMELGDADEFFTAEDDVANLDEAGMRVLEQLGSSIQMPAPEEFTQMVSGASNGHHMDSVEDGQFDNAD